MTAAKNTSPSKLLWVDLEMTGLDPRKDVILEVVARVTDFEFKTRETFHAVIHHSDAVLDAANDWCKQQFTANGLFDKVRASTRTQKDVVSELVAIVNRHFGEEKAVLAGNSIHQDRAFIRYWWPELEALLHYRMLDVSAWKVLMQGKFNVQFEKKENHRADDDIAESIAELEYYLDWFKHTRESTGA